MWYGGRGLPRAFKGLDARKSKIAAFLDEIFSLPFFLNFYISKLFFI